MTYSRKWQPLSPDVIEAIRLAFERMLPRTEHADIADRIADYWIDMLMRVWHDKPERIRQKDLSYNPSAPLSRIQQRTVVIAYADSVSSPGEKTLQTLDDFLKKNFTSVGGLHVLPACQIEESRFNDGYFSQIRRDRIHPRFGSNEQFAGLMEAYFSMADFVLNHVDIQNPKFQAYLDGDDQSGECFYVFSEKEYQERLHRGDFNNIFRPRPFPLFTLFRRKPKDRRYAAFSFQEKCRHLNHLLHPARIHPAIIGLLYLFNKIRNDQMLLEVDYRHITDFMAYLPQIHMTWDALFKISEIQETSQTPYIFKDAIETRLDLLETLGFSEKMARRIDEIYESLDEQLFGEEIRALTTFSHVQVDVNTATFEGLKMLADDFSWYLAIDLNMLRLDAANYAFKKWGTSCFGLAEVSLLMSVLYLSLNAVSPRIVANLEVNDQLGAILRQMADATSPPPMMYDFHLTVMLPVVFNTGNASILARIFELIARYEIPQSSIRFSIAESHDGKSVRGSLDLLTIAERQALADTVLANGGKIKFKSTPKGRLTTDEFKQICLEGGIDFNESRSLLFQTDHTEPEMLYLKEEIQTKTHLAEALGMPVELLSRNMALAHLCNKVIHGKEPYELCAATRDALPRIENPAADARRYLALYTLGFALMGRNVKSIYFNDLMGLPNDHDRMAKTGELRDIKRTRSHLADLTAKLNDRESVYGVIASAINDLIKLVDAAPALAPGSGEAQLLPSSHAAVAAVYNHFEKAHLIVIVNTSDQAREVEVDLNCMAGVEKARFYDHISGQRFFGDAYKVLRMKLGGFQRAWLAYEAVS